MSKTIGYRGILADGAQEKIRLRTKTGKTGYRIVKFQCMQDGFGNSEMVIKIYKKSQAGSIDNTIDFSDNTLLAACMISGSSSGEAYPEDVTVIFDGEIFNQDIYVTAAASSSADPTNYYIELEAVELSDAVATQLTLKNLRAVASRFA